MYELKFCLKYRKLEILFDKLIYWFKFSQLTVLRNFTWSDTGKNSFLEILFTTSSFHGKECHNEVRLYMGNFYKKFK